MKQTEFLKKYNLSKIDFKATSLIWKDLENIFTDYNKNRESYETGAKVIVDSLRNLKGVHSVKYRIKDAEHLIAKIIPAKKSKNHHFIVQNAKILFGE